MQDDLQHPYATLELAQALIRCRSVTPQDAGCCDLIAQRLSALGFQNEFLRFGDVTNLWSIREGGEPGPTLVLAGHTDVVPPGPEAQWKHEPFAAVIDQQELYGRGAADMKSSLAAFVVATERFIAETPTFAGRLAYLITSDEEGPAIDGTVQVVRELAHRGELLDYCIVGEPTSVKTLGDMIKNGRRGTLSGDLVIRGRQGHVAYPHLALNPIHAFAPALAELAVIRWDDGNTYFPPTTWQVSNLNAGTGASNVIPAELRAQFNFRFGSVSSPQDLKQRLEAVLSKHGLTFELQWTLGGDPYLTAPGKLCDAVSTAIQTVTGVTPELSTTGGTSDGRFIAKHCREVIEFGPTNATIHQINERILVNDLEPLTRIYHQAMRGLLTTA
ncbi:MAG: succinyl-diaminopimelate desuccinylase [Burkholderiaceae bacterium]|nr:succinyl-diaminopimelate desuccinylase [Burkholderiaceae bacterium]